MGTRIIYAVGAHVGGDDDDDNNNNNLTATKRNAH